MRTRFVLGVMGLGLGFLLLFGLRVGYGYLAVPDPAGPTAGPSSGGESFAFEVGRNNYASRKARRKGPSAGGVDQKYERVATLDARTKDFASDERRVRSAIAKVSGLVQLERKSGLEGQRRLHLAIGVDPARFDPLVSELGAIGDRISVRIDKADKTNEYRDLRAQQGSLTKSRTALIALKSQGGSIEELIQLQDRILNLEERIQQLGVSLGEFDEENEFCTVKLTLRDHVAPVAAAGIPLWQRAKVAFEWTVPVYFQLITALVFGAVFVLLALFMLERFGATLRGFFAAESAIK